MGAFGVLGAVCRAAAVALAGSAWAHLGLAEPRAGSGLPTAIVASLAIFPEGATGGMVVDGRDVPGGLPHMPAGFTGTPSPVVRNSFWGL